MVKSWAEMSSAVIDRCLEVGKNLSDCLYIGLINEITLPEITLTLCRFLGQDVTGKRLTAFYLS